MGYPSLIKPPMWALQPGLVAPERRWFWDGVESLWGMWGQSTADVRDLGPKNQPGTFLNQAHFGATDRGICLNFDGISDRVNFGSSVDYVSFSKPFTIVALVRLVSFVDQFPAICMLRSNPADIDNNYELGFCIQAGYLGLFFGARIGWGKYKTDTPAANLEGVWRHIVLTYNGAGETTAGNFSAYIDGRLQTLSAAGGFASTGNATFIGSSSSGSGDFNGDIAYVLKAGREWSAAEVLMASRDPFGPFRMRDEAGVVFAVAAAGDTLVSLDSAHILQSDAMALAQTQIALPSSDIATGGWGAV